MSPIFEWIVGVIARFLVFAGVEPTQTNILFVIVVIILVLAFALILSWESERYAHPRRRKVKTQAEPENPVVGPNAEPGESVLRFREDGSGSIFFGYFPDKETFLLDLSPGYKFGMIQQVQPKEVKGIVGQIDAAKDQGVALEGLKLVTKWGKWQVIRFLEAHVEVVVNNHPYIREPEDISLLLAKIPSTKRGKAGKKAKDEVIVLVDIIYLSGGRSWMHSKAHYWVGGVLEQDELAELTARAEAYKDREPLGPQPLPVLD